MTKQSTIGDYTFYKGIFGVTNAQVNSTTFELKATIGGQVFSDTFNRINTFKPPIGTPASIPPSNYTSNPVSSRVSIPAATPLWKNTTITTGKTTTTYITIGTGINSKATKANDNQVKAVAPKTSTFCGTDAGCDADAWVYERPVQTPYAPMSPTGTPVVVTTTTSGLIVKYTGAAVRDREVKRRGWVVGLAVLLGVAVM